MKKKFAMLTGTVLLLLALMVPVIAELPSEAIVKKSANSDQLFNRSVINPNDPGFIWGNPLAIDLSGVDPTIFQNVAFTKDPGGLMSGGLYTTSINAFRNSDPNAGDSKVTKKVAKIGLVHWP